MIKKYNQYKESGIEWIGEIPTTWETIKIKWTTPVKRGASPRPIADPKYFDDKGEFAWVRIADVTSSERYLTSTTDQLSELGASLSVKQYPGDLFLSIAGSVGKPIITKIKCCIHDGFVWFPELKINPEYLFYLFQSGLPFIGLGKVGTQLNLNTETIGNIQIPVISGDEIDKIVKYLDHQTSLINFIIEKKQQLIDKLKEQRQAIINEAVTKGLNPDVPMKDSGVEWFGEIPEHWEIKKTKYLLNEKDGIKIGPFGSALKLDTLVEEGIKVYGQGNVIKDDFEIGQRHLTYESFEDNFKQYEILPGDVLVTMMGTTGRSKVFQENFKRGILDSHLLRLRFEDEIFSSELFSVLLEESNYIHHQILLSSRGSIMAGLNSKIIKEIEILVPPLKEQKQIATYIAEKTGSLDGILKKVGSQINNLKEYRQSIISEAVTGKIDVREWEPQVKESA